MTCRSWNAHAVLMGTKTERVLEESLRLPEQLATRGSVVCASNPTLSCLPQETKTMSTQTLTREWSEQICDSQSIETTKRPSTGEWVNTQCRRLTMQCQSAVNGNELLFQAHDTDVSESQRW